METPVDYDRTFLFLIVYLIYLLGYKYVVKVSQKYMWALVQYASLQLRINEDITLYLLSFQVGRHIGKWRTFFKNCILYPYICVNLRESFPFKLYCKVDTLRKPNGDPFEMITLYTQQ